MLKRFRIQKNMDRVKIEHTKTLVRLNEFCRCTFREIRILI